MTLVDWDTNTDWTYLTVSIAAANCVCSHLQWTPPAAVTNVVMVGTAELHNVPAPTPDTSLTTTIPEFEQCYLNAGACSTSGQYAVGGIIYDDNSVSGAALPAWVTYTTSGTTAQPVNFDPTYTEIGVHDFLATFTPTYGAPVQYTAFTITVQCLVTGFMLPTAPLQAATTYVVYDDMLSADIHALGYSQIPACNYPYTVAYTWTAGLSESVRQDSQNPGQINISSIKPIDSAGTFPVELDATVTVADNNGAAESFVLPASVDFDVVITDPCTLA